MTPVEYPIKLPLSLKDVSGESVDGIALLLGTREDDSLARVIDAPDSVGWYHDDCIDKLLVYVDEPEHQLLVCREATREDFARLRVPDWIQGDDDTPECCGKRMIFVAQHEDNTLCFDEPPSDARLWWHDTANFYIFTCPYCLGVKAVGQQY